MRFRLYNRAQHDVVFGIGRSPSVDELGFTHARAYIDKHLCVVRHPFLPLGLHFRFGFSPLSRVGLLPLGYNRCWGKVGDKKLFHPLLLLVSLHHQDAANAARLFLPSYLTTEGTWAKPRLCKCGNLTGRYRFRFVRAAHHYPLLELLTRGCAIAYPTEVTHQLSIALRRALSRLPVVE